MEISLIPTNDLIKELLLRHDHAIFTAVKCVNKGSPLYMSRWIGNTATVLGLCSRVQWIINENHFKESEEANPEDY